MPVTSKTFRKTMLRAGQTYHSPDGEVVVTPERLRHWADTHRQMSAAGAVVPMHWDHGSDDDDYRPLTLSELKERKSRSSKNTVGHLQRFDVADDGQSAEVEFTTLSTDATEAMDANRVFLSPVVLEQWRDGHGTTYTDAITHLDFVDHPVDHSQSPAAPIDAVCCSIRMSSFPTGKTKAKVFRMAFDPKDESKNRSEDDDDEPQDDADERDEAPEEADEQPTDDADAEAGVSVGSVVDLLGKVGVVVPEDTDGKNLLDRLYTALLTAVANQGADDVDEKSQDTEVVDPHVATMSLQAKQALAYGERQHRASVMTRLDQLLTSGRCSPAEHEEQKKSVSAIKLSLDSQGNPAPSSVETFIEHRQSVPKGTFWDDSQKLKAARMSTVDYADGESFGGDSGPEVDPDKAADFILGK